MNYTSDQIRMAKFDCVGEMTKANKNFFMYKGSCLMKEQYCQKSHLEAINWKQGKQGN